MLSLYVDITVVGTITDSQIITCPLSHEYILLATGDMLLLIEHYFTGGISLEGVINRIRSLNVKGKQHESRRCP